VSVRRQPYQPLLEKARRYLRSAESLHQLADHDSAASRLYYAMFYCAELLLFTKGLSFSSHHAVIAAFGQHFAKTGQLPAEMHEWLRLAFDKRQQGDYGMPPAVSAQDIQDLLPKAQTFLHRTETFLQQGGFL